MRNKVHAAVLLLLSLVFIAGCAAGTDAGPVSDTALMLDTSVTITIYGMKQEPAQKAIDAAFEEIERLELLLDADGEENDLALLAGNAGTAYTGVCPEVQQVLNASLRYAELTGGALDPTIGPLVSLWNITGGSGYVPTDAERASAMALVDHTGVQVAGDGGVMLEKDGMTVNFGAIAKGYIADCVRELLLSMGAEHTIINLGGNVLAVGGKTDRDPFVVGIQDPLAETGAVLASLEVRDMSLVSSGSYERYFIQDGVRYHHILDPKTGAPAESGLAGVTILSADSIDGDALSTAVFVLGPERGLELVESLGGVECVLVETDGEVTVSSGLEGKLTFY